MSKTELERAVRWLLSNDTGSSSKALCQHMLGFGFDGHLPPSDGADRGRCIRLLNQIPEWWDRLDEMKQYSPRETIIADSKGMHTESIGWAAQIKLIREDAARLSGEHKTPAQASPPRPSLAEGEE